MSKILTHTATPDDITHIVDIITPEIVNSTYSQDLLIMTDDRLLKETIISNRVNNKDLVTVVASVEGKTVGFVTLNLDTSTMGVLYTSPKPRGVKQALISRVIHEAHKNNLASVITQIQEPTTEIMNLAHKNNFEIVASDGKTTDTMFLVCVLKPAVTQLMVTAPLQALKVDFNLNHSHEKNIYLNSASFGN